MAVAAAAGAAGACWRQQCAGQSAAPGLLHQSQVFWSGTPALVEEPSIEPALVQNPFAETATSPAWQTAFGIQLLPAKLPPTVRVTQLESAAETSAFTGAAWPGFSGALLPAAPPVAGRSAR